MEFRLAGPGDLPLLVRTRLEVLRAANGLADDADLSGVEAASRAYYARALADGAHTAVLVFDGGDFVGAGGISYYSVMPTVHNPSGRCGYVMNMYTRPAYRRRGIAAHTLDLLVRDAREKGVGQIALEATDMGRPLYAHYGFQAAEREMFLPDTTYDDGE